MSPTTRASKRTDRFIYFIRTKYMFVLLIGLLFMAFVYMHMLGLFTMSEPEKTYDVKPEISNVGINLSD